jgi:hypothetical protein
MTTRLVNDPRGGSYLETRLETGGVVREWVEPGPDRYATQDRHAASAPLLAELQPTWPEDPVADSAPAQVRVHLTRHAFERLDVELLRCDGREVGVWLLGEGDGEYPRIFGIADDGGWRRGSSERLVDTWTADTPGVCGHMHSHASGSGPSPADLHLWESVRDRLHLPAFIGMIAHVDAADMTVAPDLRVYTVTAHGGCQPASLTVGAKR